MKNKMVKSGRIVLFFWFSAVLSACALLYWVFPEMSSRELQDAALGDQTETVFGYLDGARVHCFTMADADECLLESSRRGLEVRYLWLGNSQLHAINQPNEGDEPASVIAARALRGSGVDLLTFSQPNANLQEHLVLLMALNYLWSVDFLIMPVVFDDTRENGIRPDILASVQLPWVSEQLSASEIGRSILAIDRERDTSRETFQNISEDFITSFFDSTFGWEELRSRARGAISFFLYRTRNAAFGITPNTIRRRIPSAYSINIEALQQILTFADYQGIQVLLYIPPLRSDVSRPYDAQEYSDFISEIEALSMEYGAGFANLEDIVPGSSWGWKDATGIGGQPELDFMHFQGIGHTILAEHILLEIRNQNIGF